MFFRSGGGALLLHFTSCSQLVAAPRCPPVAHLHYSQPVAAPRCPSVAYPCSVQIAAPCQLLPITAPCQSPPIAAPRLLPPIIAPRLLPPIIAPRRGLCHTLQHRALQSQHLEDSHRHLMGDCGTGDVTSTLQHARSHAATQAPSASSAHSSSTLLHPHSRASMHVSGNSSLHPVDASHSSKPRGCPGISKIGFGWDYLSPWAQDRQLGNFPGAPETRHWSILTSFSCAQLRAGLYSP